METRKAKKARRLYPETRQEVFKTDVEDSVMALIASDSPNRAFTAADMVLRGKQDQFDATIGRLCKLGCRKDLLYYCLSKLKSPVKEERLKHLPSASSLNKLAERMEEIAADIQKIESTGVLDPLDQEELSGDFEKIISGANAAWFRVLPNSLQRRAGMYKRWSTRLSDYKLRRDLLSRVNRLSLAVYVKVATNPCDSPEPNGRYELVATLMRCIGERADRSQLKREVEHFEVVHFQAWGSLEARLRASHKSTSQTCNDS
jgi:hypothetical protein